MIAFALTPVLLMPTCAATRAVILARMKTAVVKGVTTSFPILIVKLDGPALVPYLSADWRGGDVKLIAAKPGEIEQSVARLRTTGLQTQPDQHMRAFATIEEAGRGQQRIHIGVLREMAMGSSWSESWYDTDGQHVVPRYEREYSPSWTLVESAIVATPIAFAVATLLAMLAVRTRSISWTPQSRHIRAILLLALFAGGCWFFHDPTNSAVRRVVVPAAWLVFWAAVAYASWFGTLKTPWRMAIIALLVVVATALFILDQPQQADGVFLIPFLLAGLVAVAAAVSVLVERGLTTAIQLVKRAPRAS